MSQTLTTGQRPLGTRLRVSLLTACVVLCGCTVPVPDARLPTEVPDLPVTSPPPEARPTQSAESKAVQAHFKRVQANLLAQGLLRRDGGGPDTPFSQRELVANFERIALFNEYGPGGLSTVPTPTVLKRWQKPVRVQALFGPSITQDQRRKDRANVSSFAARLARVTGHPITMSTASPNMHVLFLNEDERRSYGAQIRQMMPNIDNSSLSLIETLPRDIFCAVLAFADDSQSNYGQAIVIIRGEHPDLLRLSCIHEEMAQGLGLANDSPRARPSIFNDDEEFGLLTRHDELLLRMLYDTRLRPGMNAATVRPITNVIASELLGGPS